MSYETGMVVWGASKAIGNVWIVTDGPSRTIALLFDGKNMRFCPDYKLTKHDIIKPTSYLYELTPDEFKKLTYSITGLPILPKWAQDLINLRPKTLPKSLPNSAIFAPAVVQKVQKALGINLTESEKPVKVIKDDSVCPRHHNGEHVYQPYTGLIQSFEYCIHCDKKRSLTRNGD